MSQLRGCQHATGMVAIETRSREDTIAGVSVPACTTSLVREGLTRVRCVARRIATALGAAAMTLAWQTATLAQDGTTSITVVKEPGKDLQTISPLYQALIGLVVGVLIIALVSYLLNLTLMKVARVNPMTSSRVSALVGLLLVYALLAVLFAPILLGVFKFLLYAAVALMAIATATIVLARAR